VFQSRVNEYRQQGEKCRAEAAKPMHDDLKAFWLGLASQWEALAEETEREHAKRSVFRFEERPGS
jgi:hypothetical protein